MAGIFVGEREPSGDGVSSLDAAGERYITPVLFTAARRRVEDAQFLHRTSPAAREHGVTWRVWHGGAWWYGGVRVVPRPPWAILGSPKSGREITVGPPAPQSLPVDWAINVTKLSRNGPSERSPYIPAQSEFQSEDDAPVADPCPTGSPLYDPIQRRQPLT
jgi:hypothetical protein